MKLESFGMLGNSLTGGAFACRPDRTFFWQVASILKRNGLCRQPRKPKIYGGVGGTWGGVWYYWDRFYKDRCPDILLLQGAFEQEINGGTASLGTADTNAISAEAQSITFNAATLATQIYLLYDGADATPFAGNYEWVWVDAASTTPTKCRRGLFGTTPRPWPKSTKVLTNTSTTDWSLMPAAKWRMDAMVQEILRVRPDCLLLVCDAWFGVNASVTRGIKDYVRALGRENVIFVEYTTASGTRIYDDELAKGPSATITGVGEGGGSPPVLTATCNNSVGVRNLAVGEYVAIYTNTGLAAGNVEFAKISAIDYTAKTVTFNTADRDQFGSTRGDPGSVAAGHLICKLSSVNIEPRIDINTVGAATFSGCFQYDGHPTDYGYSLLANAVWRTAEPVLAKLRD